MTRTCFLVLFGFVLVACGGKTNETTDGGGDGGPQPGPDCPSSIPASGSSCSIESIQCEYGGDVRSTCNTIATCTAGSWSIAATDTSCPTPQTNAPACPATYDQVAQGSSCPSMGTECNYSTSAATRFCLCTYMGGYMPDGGMNPTWQCTYAPQTGCPAARPHIGATCSQPGLDCTYDICGAPMGLTFQCSAQTGTWIEGFMDACAGASN